MLEDATLHYEHGTHWSACSIMGPGRDRNADSLAVDLTGACLAFAVADGVGSMPGAPLASTAAVRTFADSVSARGDFQASEIMELYQEICRRVLEATKAAELEGATTLVAAVISRSGAVIAAVGDSEAMVVGSSGPATRLNQLDHLAMQPNVLTAWIDGQSEFEPHVSVLDKLPERLVLVSDGISGVLSYEDIADVVRGVPSAEAAHALALAAREAGTRDDATALVIGPRVMEETRRGLFSSRRRRRVLFGEG